MQPTYKNIKRLNRHFLSRIQTKKYNIKRVRRVIGCGHCFIVKKIQVTLMTKICEYYTHKTLADTQVCKTFNLPIHFIHSFIHSATNSQPSPTIKLRISEQVK